MNLSHTFFPDLTRILGQERDWGTLEWAWKGWRDETGKKMKEMYSEYTDLQNEGALLNGMSITVHIQDLAD